MSTIKFYSNFKDGKVFVSGQNEKGTWFTLWKSTEFNKDLYLQNDKFKGGLEIDKSLLKLHDNEPGCRVLVFKDAEEEAKYCITKEEIERRKKQRTEKSKVGATNVFDYIADIVLELFDNNKDLKYAPKGLIESILTENDKKVLEEIKEDEYDLPF